MMDLWAYKNEIEIDLSWQAMPTGNYDHCKVCTESAGRSTTSELDPLTN